jgi:hypothetical protein
MFSVKEQVKGLLHGYKTRAVVERVEVNGSYTLRFEGSNDVKLHVPADKIWKLPANQEHKNNCDERRPSLIVAAVATPQVPAEGVESKTTQAGPEVVEEPVML